jgi:hypothetical protein
MANNFKFLNEGWVPVDWSSQHGAGAGRGARHSRRYLHI